MSDKSDRQPRADSQPGFRLEDIMKSEPDERLPSAVGRWALAAGAVLLVAAGVAGYTSFTQNNTPHPAVSRIVVLHVPALEPGMVCTPPSAEALRRMERAFDATAIAVNPDLVALRVHRWYQGGSTKVVELTRAIDVGSVLESGIGFEPRGRYLIAATHDTVRICSFSATWNHKLARMFEATF